MGESADEAGLEPGVVLRGDAPRSCHSRTGGDATPTSCGGCSHLGLEPASLTGPIPEAAEPALEGPRPLLDLVVFPITDSSEASRPNQGIQPT